MTGTRTRYTRKDLERIPRDLRAELVDGVIFLLPVPDESHDRLVRKLALHLDGHRWTASPAGMPLNEDDLCLPDLVVVPPGRRTGPVWVAEVLSPETEDWDKGPKLRAYARAGIREAWIADPRGKSIEVLDLEAGTRSYCGAGEVACSRVLKGLSVAVDGLFSPA